jgi:hypothetical protein
LKFTRGVFANLVNKSFVLLSLRATISGFEAAKEFDMNVGISALEVMSAKYNPKGSNNRG